MPDIFITEAEKKEAPRAAHKKKKTIASGSAPGLFASYCYYPKKVKFSTQEIEEKVVLFLRRHFITNLGWIFMTFIMAAAPVVLVKFPLLTFLPIRFQTVAVLIWYLLTIAYAFEKFLDWYFSVFIITDERVIDVDFVNLIYRELKDAGIDRIQDTTVKMGGVVQSLFNYGSLHIQTAGEIPDIIFEQVPKPDKVSSILRELIMEEKQEEIEGRVR